MSYQYSTTTTHSDETHLESFVESIISSSLPNEIRRNLEHLRDLDDTSTTVLETWRNLQDDCLRNVERILGGVMRERMEIMEEERARMLTMMMRGEAREGDDDAEEEEEGSDGDDDGSASVGSSDDNESGLDDNDNDDNDDEAVKDDDDNHNDDETKTNSHNRTKDEDGENNETATDQEIQKNDDVNDTDDNVGTDAAVSVVGSTSKKRKRQGETHQEGTENDNESDENSDMEMSDDDGDNGDDNNNDDDDDDDKGQEEKDNKANKKKGKTEKEGGHSQKAEREVEEKENNNNSSKRIKIEEDSNDNNDNKNNDNIIGGADGDVVGDSNEKMGAEKKDEAKGKVKEEEENDQVKHDKNEGQSTTLKGRKQKKAKSKEKKEGRKQQQRHQQKQKQQKQQQQPMQGQDPREYVPTTEELIAALLNPPSSVTQHDGEGNTTDSSSDYLTQKHEINTLHQKLKQYSSEKIKTAHQLQHLVDMALGRLDRDLEKFEKELGIVPVVHHHPHGHSHNPHAHSHHSVGSVPLDNGAGSALNGLGVVGIGGMDATVVATTGRHSHVNATGVSIISRAGATATSAALSASAMMTGSNNNGPMTSTNARTSSGSASSLSTLRRTNSTSASCPVPIAQQQHHHHHHQQKQQSQPSFARSYSSSMATGTAGAVAAPPMLKHSQSSIASITTSSLSSNAPFITTANTATASAIHLPHNSTNITVSNSTVASLPLASRPLQPPHHHHHQHHLHPAIHQPQPQPHTLLPPPQPITKNPTTKNLAAIQVTPNTPDWILAKINSFDKNTRMYTLIDEDVESDNIYTLPEKQVVVLKKGTSERNMKKWVRGDAVYAVYPDTTSFYHATVSQGARKLSSVGPGGMVVVGGGGGGAGVGVGGGAGSGGAGWYVMVLFQDDGDENGLTHEKAVPVQYVMKVPPGAAPV